MQNSIQRIHSKTILAQVLASPFDWQAGKDIRYTDGDIPAKKLIALKLRKIRSIRLIIPLGGKQRTV